MAVISLVTLAALAVGAQAWLALPPAAAPSAEISDAGGPSRRAEPAANPQRLEAELITLLPSGIDPAEIRRPRGPFVLAVENRSGSHELDLRLSRENGERLHEARMLRGRLGWKKHVDLPPGSYLLTEANHPDWVCRITITPR